MALQTTCKYITPMDQQTYIPTITDTTTTCCPIETAFPVRDVIYRLWFIVDFNLISRGQVKWLQISKNDQF